MKPVLFSRALFPFAVLTGSHCVTWRAWNSLHRPDWPQTHEDPPASAACVLRFKVCVTALGLLYSFYRERTRSRETKTTSNDWASKGRMTAWTIFLTLSFHFNEVTSLNNSRVFITGVHFYVIPGMLYTVVSQDGDMPKVVTECSPPMDFLQAYLLFIHDNSSQSKAKHKNQLGFQASSAEAIRVLSEIPTTEKCRHLDVQRKHVVSKIHSQNIFTMPVNIPSSIINYGFISKTLLI